MNMNEPHLITVKITGNSLLFTDKSKDASYLGKILEGFTLAQKPAEDKTVSFFNPQLIAR